MIQIFKQNGNTSYGLNEYMIDTKAELSQISTNITMGSTVFVIEENKTYILNGNKEWVEKISAAAGGVSQETDPTVPNWAKQPEKPTYTAKEVGALSSADVTSNYADQGTKPVNGRAVAQAIKQAKEYTDEKAVTVDQTYDAESKNAQSGIAVAEALSQRGGIYTNLLEYIPTQVNYVGSNLESFLLYLCVLGDNGEYRRPGRTTLKDIKDVIIGDIDTALDELDNKVTTLETSLNGLEDFLATI